jgi:acetyl esterase/lipase
MPVKLAGLAVSCLLYMNVYSQQVIPLYKDAIPNSKTSANTEVKAVDKSGNERYSKISIPTVTIYTPPKEKNNGGAILICPGGGYGIVSYINEGVNVAEAFNQMGFTAFILKYRLPLDSLQPNKSIAPVQDAQQAIRLIRLQAADWKIDPARVGIIGFSAGGHLASTVITHFDTAFVENKENISLRPDFAILGYPVISFSDSLAHKGSRTNLIGNNASAELINYYSSELQVKPNTPPTLLFHAQDDKGVKVENSIAFYLALTRNKVPSEMILYPAGGHGFGTNNKTTGDKWTDRVADWLKANKWMP